MSDDCGLAVAVHILSIYTYQTTKLVFMRRNFTGCVYLLQTPYSTAWNAIIRTAVMMIGEFDYNDIFHGEDDMHYYLTYVLFCSFLVIMTIIIMNLLVCTVLHYMLLH